MGTNAIIAAIDKELDRLQKIRSLLIQKGSAKSPGSPAKSGKKRRLSAAARARIAEAQRRRWANVRNARG